MICPKCTKEFLASEATDACPHCGFKLPPLDVEPPKPWRKRHPLLMRVHIVAAVTIVGGLGGNIALIRMPGLEFLGFLFLPIAIYFLFSAMLVALPLWWPTSALFAWSLDRNHAAGKPLALWQILVINGWTVVAGGIGLALLHVRVSTGGLTLTLTNGLASDTDVMQGILMAGCMWVPWAWSAGIAALAVKRKQHRTVAIAAGILAIFVNILCTAIYPAVKTSQLQSAEHQRFEESLNATGKTSVDPLKAKQAAEDAARKRAQVEVTQEVGATLLTADGAPASANLYTSPYGVVAVEHYADFVSAGHYRSIVLREMKTTEADPYHKASASDGSCFPNIPGKSLLRSPDHYPCVYEGTTPKGTRIYHVPVVSGDAYEANHYFVKNGLFVDLSISVPKDNTGNPSAEVPVSTIVDGLVPINTSSLTILP